MNTIKKTQAANRIADLKRKAEALPAQVEPLKEQLAHARARRKHLVAEKSRMKRTDPKQYDRGFFNTAIAEEDDHIRNLETQYRLLSEKATMIESEIKFIRLLTRGE